MILVEDDTLYFENKKDYTQPFAKIDTSPFDIEKALKGEKVKLNHPDGYFDAKSRMLRNGDEITVISYSNSTKEIKFKIETSSFLYLPIEYLIIDWEAIKKKYPKLEILPEEM
jgi:pyruvate/2-oxoglutarate/acetoin dehydrogenase E1 component